MSIWPDVRLDDALWRDDLIITVLSSMLFQIPWWMYRTSEGWDFSGDVQITGAVHLSDDLAAFYPFSCLLLWHYLFAKRDKSFFLLPTTLLIAMGSGRSSPIVSIRTRQQPCPTPDNILACATLCPLPPRNGGNALLSYSTSKQSWVCVILNITFS